MVERILAESTESNRKSKGHYEAVRDAATERFDRLAKLAASFLGTEVALISLVGPDGQWWHAAHGVAQDAIPSEGSFCARVAAQRDMIVILDKLTDPILKDDTLLFGNGNIRFGAGVPLVAEDGFPIGAFCVAGGAPRPAFSDKQKDILHELAAIAMDEIELTMSYRSAHQGRMRLAEVVSCIPEGVIVFDESDRLVAINAAMKSMAPLLAPHLVPGRTFSEIYDFGRRELLSAIVEQNIETNMGWVEHIEGRTQDGRFLHVRIPRTKAGERFVFCTDVTELNKREEKLRQTETVISRAEELGKFGYFVFDVETFETEYISPGIFKIGESLDPQEEHVGYEQLLRRVDPDDLERVQNSTLDAIKNGSRLDIEFRARTASGGIEHLWLTDATLQEANTGRALRVGLVQDLTERREKEAALEEALVHKRAIVETALDCIIVIDDAGCVTEFNPAAEKTFGYAKKDILGQSLAETIVPKSYRAAHTKGLARYAETGIPHVVGRRVEIEACRADGSLFPVELSITPVQVGERRFFSAYLRDISERVRDRKELERKESLLATALDLAELGSFEWDVKADNIIWSDQTYQIVGIDQNIQRINLDSYWQHIHKDDAVMVRRALDKALQDREDYMIEHRLVRPDGAIRFVAARGRVQLHEDGSVEKIVGTIQDVTNDREREIDLRTAIEAAEVANAAKSDFLATISHEIRTPLNGVLGTLNLLDETPLDAEQKQYAKTALNSGEHLLTLINDILDLSKFEAGQFQLEMSPLNPRDLATSIGELLNAEIDRKGLSFSVKSSNNLPHAIVSDATRLNQIMLNLVSNAVKFTDEGRVDLSLDWEGTGDEGHLIVAVNDTGIGIAQENQATLFNRFTQVESSTSRHYEGTGLGLAICWQIAELLGGRIAVESELGQGSCFTVRIPSKAVRTIEKKAKTTQELKPTTLHGRILLAEDSQTNAMVATAILRKKGLRVDHVSDGLEALDALKARHYDLILMDVSMPGMDGLDATRSIRNGEVGASDIPILAMTAHAGDRSMVECRDVGMNDFVLKPFDKFQFVSTVARWLPKQDETKEAADPLLDEISHVLLLDKSVESGVWSALPSDVLLEILQHYLGELDVAASQMSSGTVDRTALQRIAHTLASSSANVGAMQMCVLAVLVETTLSEGKMPDINADTINEIARLTRAEIKSEMTQLETC